MGFSTQFYESVQLNWLGESTHKFPDYYIKLDYIVIQNTESLNESHWFDSFSSYKIIVRSPVNYVCVLGTTRDRLLTQKIMIIIIVGRPILKN